MRIDSSPKANEYAAVGFKHGEPHNASLVRNGLYNVGTQITRGVVGVLTIPLLIRYLGIREYGVWSLAYAVLILVTMSEAGISVAAAVFLSRDLARNDFSEAGRTLTFVLISAAILSISLGLILWFAGPIIVHPLAAFGSAERADAGRALQIGGVAVAALIFQRALVGVEQALDKYAAISALDFFYSVSVNIGLVVLASLGGRAVEMMKWQAFACAFFLAAHCFFVFWLFRGTRLSFDWCGKKARTIFRFSLGTWVATLGSAAFSQCDRLIVGGVLGATPLGIYSAITNMTSRINLFSGAAVQPLVATLNRDAATRASHREQIRVATHLNALMAIEGGICLYVLADWAIRIMIPGATTSQAIWGLKIAAIIYAIYSMNAPGYYAVFSAGHSGTNGFVTFSSAVVSLGLIFLGARSLGLVGALAGNAGYLGTLFLVIPGLRMLGVRLRSYLAWMAIPFLGLAAALVAGLVLEAHFWWRTAFVVLQGAVFVFWFLRSKTEASWTRFGFGRVLES